jgi:hypothetical protein
MPLSINELTFIHVPKTAGASITTWFVSNFRSLKRHDMKIHTLHPSTEMFENLTSETFAVVRNPWDRVVSLWAFWKKIKKTDVPFDTFVRNLGNYKFAEQSWFTFDQPQKAWFPNGVTHLLKFETLEEDFKVIQEKLGCNEPLPRLNTSEHDDYHTYYTPETWDIVANVFKDDIEEFGYTNYKVHL